MSTKKMQALTAALALTTLLSSPVFAALDSDIAVQAESMISSGDISAFLGFLNQHPELKALSGQLGDSIRKFTTNPSPTNLNAINSQQLSTTLNSGKLDTITMATQASQTIY